MAEGSLARLVEALLSGGRLVLGAALSAVGRATRLASMVGGSGAEEPFIEEGRTDAPTPKRTSGAVAFESDAIEPMPAAWTKSPRAPSDQEMPSSPALPQIPEADRLTVVARDSETLFAYWEIRPRTRARALATLGAPPHASVREALRVRVADDGRTRGTEQQESRFLELPPLATSRYVESVPAGERLEVSLGLVFEGRFALLASAAPVSTPPATTSADRRAVWRQIGSDRRPTKAIVPSPTTLATLDAGFELPDLDGLASTSSAAGGPEAAAATRSPRRP